MKRVAISQRLVDHTEYKETRSCLDLRWTDVFRKLNYIPLIIPQDYPCETFLEQTKAQALILSGGNDLQSLSPNALSAQRDSFERDLIQTALLMNIPIFGVCRGMLLLADFFESSFHEIDKHVATRHELYVHADSRHKERLRKLNTVNSFHKFSVKSLGRNLIASARCPKGYIEALEHRTLPIFGQMWHPEREDPLQELEIELLGEVLK
ncbi:MAG: gamma-glutamyl-gamma-aminobutyrate hydrolase PuuD [Chlamydiales bacterium]|jgi:gamma-glutamyl-gamma-aminobutyrate hydrolase PuuD